MDCLDTREHLKRLNRVHSSSRYGRFASLGNQLVNTLEHMNLIDEAVTGTLERFDPAVDPLNWTV